MSHFYVACHLGPGSGRVSLGTLHKDQMNLAEVARFRNVPFEGEDSVYWDIPQLYHEVSEALRALGAYEEPVDSISVSSWGGDYLLFGTDGSLVSPTYHFADPRGELGLQKVLSKIPWEELYDATGAQQAPSSTLCQLAAEKSRRLKHARHLLPIADGFNYLLSGVPRVELSAASATQLLNPATKDWSRQLGGLVHLDERLLPPIVPGGTVLGPLRPELAKQPGLEEARLVAACSNEAAAALASLPVNGADWAFLRQGNWTVVGAAVPSPIVGERSREAGFGHELGHDGTIYLQKQGIGLWLLQECQRFWEQKGCGLDDEMLTHLAGSAPPFESLINPADPRFLEPGDMPMKIQAFCKETYQPVPRKPGAIIRCVLESMAFLYRRLLGELAAATGREPAAVYVLGGTDYKLLNHFTANALQLPVVVVPPEAPVIGSVLVQALALKHIETVEEAREIAGQWFRFETIQPHANACLAAYERLEQLLPC